MPDRTPSKQSPTVFISYAHESDALRAAVRKLAVWLSAQECSVMTDHPFVDRPPPEGWQAWMLGCIDQADTVLVVCTPRLKSRYEKTAVPDAGRGATYEGAIVTQRIYDDVMRNTKFFPILPDGGNEDDIPTALKSWWNGHRFRQQLGDPPDGLRRGRSC
ncbi:MAG: toll/interleukin-1 receptor domain-containing protein [Candidatus Eiseniibacteriota bacterium]